MDATALADFHAALRAQGFAGAASDLLALLRRADQDSKERSVLSHWNSTKAPRQATALKAIYAHARKRGMDMITFDFDMPERVEFSMSRGRSFRGVCLGRVEIDQSEVRLCFYRGNELVSEKSFRA